MKNEVKGRLYLYYNSFEYKDYSTQEKILEIATKIELMTYVNKLMDMSDYYGYANKHDIELKFNKIKPFKSIDFTVKYDNENLIECKYLENEQGKFKYLDIQESEEGSIDPYFEGIDSVMEEGTEFYICYKFNGEVETKLKTPNSKITVEYSKVLDNEVSDIGMLEKLVSYFDIPGLFAEMIYSFAEEFDKEYQYLNKKHPTIKEYKENAYKNCFKELNILTDLYFDMKYTVNGSDEEKRYIAKYSLDKDYLKYLKAEIDNDEQVVDLEEYNELYEIINRENEVNLEFKKFSETFSVQQMLRINKLVLNEGRGMMVMKHEENLEFK